MNELQVKASKCIFLSTGEISLTLDPDYPNDGDSVTLTCTASNSPIHEIHGDHHSNKECTLWWTRTSFPARTVSREPVINTGNTRIVTVCDKSTSPPKHVSKLTIKKMDEAMEGQYTCSYYCPGNLEAANLELKTYGKYKYFTFMDI